MMKKLFRSPVATGLLFVLSVILLFAGGIGGAQAEIGRASCRERV